jgi:hypothetical protein
VDGVAQKHSDKLRVIQVDFLSPVGWTAARKYGVWLVPAVILFDEQGQEVTRQLGMIDPRQITARLSLMKSSTSSVIGK